MFGRCVVECEKILKKIITNKDLDSAKAKVENFTTMMGKVSAGKGYSPLLQKS